MSNFRSHIGITRGFLLEVATVMADPDTEALAEAGYSAEDIARYIEDSTVLSTLLVGLAECEDTEHFVALVRAGEGLDPAELLEDLEG